VTTWLRCGDVASTITLDIFDVWRESKESIYCFFVRLTELSRQFRAVSGKLLSNIISCSVCVVLVRVRFAFGRRPPAVCRRRRLLPESHQDEDLTRMKIWRVPIANLENPERFEDGARELWQVCAYTSREISLCRRSQRRCRVNSCEQNFLLTNGSQHLLTSVAEPEILKRGWR